MSSINWEIVDELSFDLVNADGFGFPAAVAEIEAHRHTRDAITAALLEAEVVR